MVSIVGKRIQAGMSFHSHDSDDADSAQGSENGTQDDGSARVFFSNVNRTMEIKKVNTIWVGCALIFITLALYVTAIMATVNCREGPRRIIDRHGKVKTDVLCYVPSVSFIMYLQALLWGIFLIFDQYIQYEHIKARRRGHLDFYNETRTLSQLPFFTVSAWCALLLAVVMVLNDNCLSELKCGKTIPLGKAEYALLCVGLQGILIVAITSVYIYKIHTFNRSHPLPDVLYDEFMAMATDYNPNSLGQIDEEVFQRQADVIRYLTEQNVILKKNVMDLNHQLLHPSQPSV